MSEWLTTGQMLDRLKVGEIAELDEKFIKGIEDISYNAVTKTSDGDIIWKRKNNLLISGDVLEANGVLLNFKWRIIPEFVSFEKAMEGFMKGMVVKSWVDSEDIPYHVHYPQKCRDFVHKIVLLDEEVKRFSQMKWTVEGEPQ